MILHFGLSSYLLLLLRFLLLLLLSDAGTLTTMDAGLSPSILMVTSQDYVLFTGDFAVNYTLGDSVSSDDLQVQLINHVDDSQMAVLSLPSNSSEGQLVVACGTINTTGSIFFALSSKDSDLVVAVSETVHVSWPPVVIRTSTGSHSFPALTENIAVEVIVNDWDRLTCPGNDSATEYSVTLDYYGSSDWRSSADSPSPRSMHRINITRFFHRREHSVTFHCRIVDQPGDYLVVLRSPKSSTIAVSDYLEVYWNPGSYELRSTLAAVFPCFHDVTVSFKRPRCAANDDKIRLYRQLRHENVTLASSSTLSYVAERRTTKLSNQVTFGCGEFEEEPAPSYCWKYVSTARSGATYEHSTFCLPATTKDRPTNGEWSTWSEWSACSATCLSGTQVRFRSCDNPPPANGGTFCDGPMTESRQCDVICPELSPPTTSLSHIPSTNSSCDCGCRMTESEGAVVAVPGCPSVVQWVIAVKAGLTIRLTFLVFDLESDGQAGVRVRDGESAMSNLLLNSFGGGDAGSPADVVSSGSVLTIEFRAPANSSGGFVAKYSAQAPNTSHAGGVPQTESSAWETPVWKSTAIIVGVSLCVIVVTIAVVIVCCDVGANRAKRRRKKRLNTKGHTVAFDTVPPKTIELDYEEVPSYVRMEVPSAAGVGLEVVRVYPITGSDEITTSKFLATSSPYLGVEGRDPGRRSSGRKRSRTRGGASERNAGEGGLVRHPVDSQPLRHSSKTGKHRRHSRNDGDDVARNKRRPKSRDRKPPLPSSTFEEDLLMLSRQTEVTEGGGAAVTLDTRLGGPLGSGASPEQPKLKGSFSRSRPTPKCDTPEKIPLQSKEIKVRSRRNRAHNSSAQARAAAQGGEMTERGHGVIVGQRPPVEGSYDTVPDSSFRTSTDATVEHREIVQGQKVKDESTVNVSTLKDGSTSMGGSGVVVALTGDSGDPRVTESDKSRWMLGSATNNDPDGSGKKASSFRTVNGSATGDRVQDQGLHIQSFLRPDPGPDGQSQRGTFHSNSNSLACSNSPLFRMSTERTSTHSTFRPVPVPARSERLSQSPDATPRQAKSSSPHLHGIAPRASTGTEETCKSSVPIGSSPSQADTLVPSLPNHDMEEEAKDTNPGLLKTDLHSNGTIPGPL